MLIIINFVFMDEKDLNNLSGVGLIILKSRIGAYKKKLKAGGGTCST